MKYLNNLPVYGISAENTDETITCVSLVANPAMEVPMLLFNSDKQSNDSSKPVVSTELKPVVTTLSKHNILTCIIRTNYPIYRRNGQDEYYVVFNQEVTRLLCQKLMTDGYQQVVSLNHDGKPITGMQLEQVFIKDSSRGISPEGFEDVAEGSLFGIYHITDDQLWQDCLDGKFAGVSLESILTINEKFNKVSKMSKLKEAIKNLLLQFDGIATDKGELTWNGDEQLKVGDEVFIEDQPAPDGEYKTADQVVVVAAGVVTEIRPVAEPEEPVAEEIVAEEVVEPEAEPEAEMISKLVALEARVADLEARLAELVAKPAVEPIEEEFEAQATNTGLRQSNDFGKSVASTELKLRKALEVIKSTRRK